MINITGFVRSTEKHGVSPVNYYRAMLPLNTLGKKSDRFNVTVLTQDTVRQRITSGVSDTILGEDVYVVSRLYKEEGRQEFLDTIHRNGGLVVFDTDDDLTCDHRELGRGDEFKRMVETTDLVTVSTPYLSRRISEYTGYRPPVLYNHVDVEWFSRTSMRAKRSANGLSIGFIGTASHEGDWIYPVKALLKIAEENPDITLVTAGYVPPYLQEVTNIVKLDPVPYRLYPELIRQFDIVCCSLDPNDEFNRSKSAIKSLEAMSAARVLSNGKIGGAVPVCTDMTVYRRVIGKHNGVLTSNDCWYDALSMLIKNEPLRNRLAVQGYKWVKKNRNMATIGYKAWGKVYRDLIGGKYDNLPRTRH